MYNDLTDLDNIFDINNDNLSENELELEIELYNHLDNEFWIKHNLDKYGYKLIYYNIKDVYISDSYNGEYELTRLDNSYMVHKLYLEIELSNGITISDLIKIFNVSIDIEVEYTFLSHIMLGSLLINKIINNQIEYFDNKILIEVFEFHPKIGIKDKFNIIIQLNTENEYNFTFYTKCINIHNYISHIITNKHYEVLLHNYYSYDIINSSSYFDFKLPYIILFGLNNNIDYIESIVYYTELKCGCEQISKIIIPTDEFIHYEYNDINFWIVPLTPDINNLDDFLDYYNLDNKATIIEKSPIYYYFINVNFHEAISDPLYLLYDLNYKKIF